MDRFSAKTNKESEDVFSVLYDDHTIYLDSSDAISSQNTNQGKIQQQKTLKSTLLINKTAINGHLKYLSQLQFEYEIRFEAAKKIRNCWIQHNFRKQFQQIKKLLHQYALLDPISVIKKNNPREAAMFDRVNNVILKFKLSGVDFPPNIVYKIYSARPVIVVDTLQTLPRFECFANSANCEIQNKNIWRPYIHKTFTPVRKRSAKIKNHKMLIVNRKSIKHVNELDWIKKEFKID